jgi:hypothetical protein
MQLLIASSCFDCLSAGPVKRIGLYPPNPVADGQSKQLTWHWEERTLREMGTFAMNLDTERPKKRLCATQVAGEGAGIFRPTGAVLRDTITAAFNADPQKIGGATRPGGALAHAHTAPECTRLPAFCSSMKTGVVLACVFTSGQNKDRKSDLSECDESVCFLRWAPLCSPRRFGPASQPSS